MNNENPSNLPKYLDYNLSIDERVDDLLDRLTLEEKISLLSNIAPAINRLGIQRYDHGNEALHGVVRPGTATVFPQAIAFAATWNPDLIHEVADAISDEARAKHNETKGVMQLPRSSGLLTFWSPTVNMARDPRWGRTPETYGEDPYLAGRIGVAFVKGLQGNHPKYLKAVSTPKHYVANNEEHNRFECQTNMSERMLREYYLPAFKACVVEGKAQSIMSAYNAVGGVPCTASRKLLIDILREEWGFKGYVVTDCNAIYHMYKRHRFAKDLKEAAALAINAGIDLECGTVFEDGYLLKAVEDGMVEVDTIDRAARNVLIGRFKLGMFDPPDMVPFSKLTPDVVGCEKHTELALRTARESIVLLKNKQINGKRLLPLNQGSISSVAVVGPFADRCEFGHYSGVPKNEPVSPLKGIQNKIADNIVINHVPWRNIFNGEDFVPIPAENLMPEKAEEGEHGLTGVYYSNENFEGEPVGVRIDKQIKFDWDNEPPDPFITTNKYSIRWSGKLIADISGEYRIRMVHNGSPKYYRPKLYIGGVCLGKGESFVYLEAKRVYDIKLEYVKEDDNPVIQLEWSLPVSKSEDLYAPEKEAAGNSDVVIAVIGINTDYEKEGVDRRTLDLPDSQLKLIEEIVKVNPNTIVVLENGSPLSINWIDENVPAIIEAWYPGEQGGNAIADVLFGDYNPGGRLPLTFYKSIEQLLPFNEYEVLKGRTYMYLEGTPLYPFGYGLSYTTFSYSNIVTDAKKTNAEGKINVSVDIQNTGEWDGDEVVQLYISNRHSKVKQPIKQLKGFKRIHLKKGETKTVEFELNIQDLGYYDEHQKKFIVEPGKFNVLVGASSSDIRLRDEFTVVG